MSLWKRLFGKKSSDAEPETPPRPLRDIPDAMMANTLTLSCDPHAADPERRFTVGRYGLTLATDEESQRFGRSVLKRSAGKSLRLEPNAEVGHRGVISRASEGSGYRWIYVDVDLKAGIISFRDGQAEG